MQTQVKEPTAVDLENELRETKIIETRPADLSDLVAVDAFFDDPRVDAVAITQKEARRKAMMRTCFAMTSASQWVKFEDKSSGKATVYPMGGAADAILRQVFACTWQEKQVHVEYDNQGEPLSAVASGWLCNSKGQHIEQFSGFLDMGGFIKTKADLIKGALENMKSVAVRDVLGLRGRAPEELATLGLDLSKVETAEFANNKQGADAAVLIPFGAKKGKAITDPEVTLKDLEYYAKKATETIANPEKKKWHKAEQIKLDAYRAEYKRRVDAAKAPPATASGSATSTEAKKQEAEGDDYPPEELAAACNDLFPPEPGARG